MSAARHNGDDLLMRALGVAGIAWGSAILTAGSSHLAPSRWSGTDTG